jgi:hypothetical protein
MTTLRREGVYRLPNDKVYVALPAERRGRHFLYAYRETLPLIPDYVMNVEGYIVTWPDELRTPWSSRNIIDTGETYHRIPPVGVAEGVLLRRAKD